MLDKLEKGIKYTFVDRGLLEQALTHRSADRHNNERLEFLGDAILNYLVAEMLYIQRAEATEGEMTRLRAKLVNKESLANIAADLNLGDFLRLGGGEQKSGGFRRESILADGVEALIGAIYLDSSIDTCRAVVTRLIENRIKVLPTLEDLKDSKTKLQELLQARRMALPDYRILAQDGPPHQQKFTIECVIGELDLRVETQANSRRKAEQQAAGQLLVQLEQIGF